MNRESIDYILFKENGKVLRIELDEMTKDFYHQNRNNIFCPNNECTANIEYCEGAKRKFFRTVRTHINGDVVEERHILDCPFGLEHDLSNKSKSIFDPSIAYPISDDHIMRSLKRAHQNHKRTENGNAKKPSNRKKRDTNSIFKIEESDKKRGKGIIAFNSEDESKDDRRSEPILHQRYPDDLTELDFDNSRMIKGNITEFKFEENYIAISLESQNNKKVRVYFSEEYKVNNSQQYSQIKVYEDYFVNQTNIGQKVFFECAGDVIKDEFGASIYAKSHKHILIDGLSHYELLKKYW